MFLFRDVFLSKPKPSLVLKPILVTQRSKDLTLLKSKTRSHSGKTTIGSTKIKPLLERRLQHINYLRENNKVFCISYDNNWTVLKISVHVISCDAIIR